MIINIPYGQYETDEYVVESMIFRLRLKTWLNDLSKGKGDIDKAMTKEQNLEKREGRNIEPSP